MSADAKYHKIINQVLKKYSQCVKLRLTIWFIPLDDVLLYAHFQYFAAEKKSRGKNI